ncbi:helix-turn-helix domain-containing protein [Streptomyces sp. DG2A-72]|uniref:helix-turn-helix domain-containing protein n=1 Tax=Streptomyces sp. DG2A-72 TaxID=3051386 RepID=UPI003464CE0D
MRYAQGGGLTAERRRFREGIRYEAGERFDRGEKTAVIAKDLRVSERSVERWLRAGRESGMAVLASAGPPKLLQAVRWPVRGFVPPPVPPVRITSAKRQAGEGRSVTVATPTAGGPGVWATDGR